jgi:class 3 adenylate cyclase
MFCDLVGSTALSARLDPEDLRAVISAYHHAVGKTVAGFEGFVAKYMGDGVLACFGYPRAHEDDAERAVRAGLGLIDAIGRLDVVSAHLQARVGIATGPVVVGDLIGDGPAQEHAVVGETPNLAVRLQALAEPDAVVNPGKLMLRRAAVCSSYPPPGGEDGTIRPDRPQLRVRCGPGPAASGHEMSDGFTRF